MFDIKEYQVGHGLIYLAFHVADECLNWSFLWLLESDSGG